MAHDLAMCTLEKDQQVLSISLLSSPNTGEGLELPPLPDPLLRYYLDEPLKGSSLLTTNTHASIAHASVAHASIVTVQVMSDPCGRAVVSGDGVGSTPLSRAWWPSHRGDGPG